MVFFNGSFMLLQLKSGNFVEIPLVKRIWLINFCNLQQKWAFFARKELFFFGCELKRV
jgi:hypothetical protein